MMISTKNFTLAAYAKGDQDAKRLALVLPGRLDTKDYVSMRSHVDFLAGKGYYAVSFDPPGTWESPGDISLFTTTNYIKAINEIIEHFGNRPTILLGHSRGGSVAILAGVPNNAVKVIVPIMATYGPPSAPTPEAVRLGYQMSYRDLPPGDHETKEKRIFKLPVAYFEDGAKYGKGELLVQCHKPVLMFFGTEDEFTEPQRVKEVFDTIPGPKQLHELSCAHDYRLYPAMIEEVNKVTGAFLESIRFE